MWNKQNSNNVDKTPSAMMCIHGQAASLNAAVECTSECVMPGLCIKVFFFFIVFFFNFPVTSNVKYIYLYLQLFIVVSNTNCYLSTLNPVAVVLYSSLGWIYLYFIKFHRSYSPFSKSVHYLITNGVCVMSSKVLGIKASRYVRFQAGINCLNPVKPN